MPDKNPTAKRQAIQKQLSQLKAKLQMIDARERDADRKARTRRVIILGEALLTALERGETVSISNAAIWLQSQQLRPQDRAAWGIT